mgnify:CR=1 FL=1
MYLTALGPQGLKETAELCLQKAHYAAEQLTAIPGVSLRFARPFFKEFALRIRGDVAAVLQTLQKQGIFGGLALGRWSPELRDTLIVAVTEKRTKAEIDQYATALREALRT